MVDDEGERDERASWKRGRVPSEATDDGRAFHCFIDSGKKLFLYEFVLHCTVVYLVLVGLSRSRPYCPCHKGWQGDRPLVLVGFCRTSLRMISDDGDPVIPTVAAVSCQLASFLFWYLLKTTHGV